MRGRPLRPTGPVVAALTVAALTVAAVGAVASAPGASARDLGGAGAPRRGGSVVWGLEAETSGGWCPPQQQWAIAGITVGEALFDTLTTIDARGRGVPFLAKSITPNATYDEWTIRLRPGIRFHDGEPLDADAVKLNLDSLRGANPRLPARLSLFVFQDVADVTVADPLTVVVRMRKPWPTFPAILWGGGRFGMAAPAQLNDPGSCARNPIGTGPFRFERWIPDRELVVTRNADYWRRGLPYLDRVVFRPVPDPTARLNQLEGGQLDVAHFDRAQQVERLRELRAAGRLNSVEERRGFEVGYVLLNVGKAPFDDPLARRIFATARDVAELNRVVNRGLFPIARGPFPPGSLGHLRDPGFPGHDLAEARRLARRYEAEHGSPLAFEYQTVPDPEQVRVAELMKEQLAKVGVRMTIGTFDQATLINRALAGSYDATVARNHPGGDPDLQYVWWHGGSPVDFGRIADPELDRLLEAGRLETDPAARARIYRSVNRRFAKQLYDLWAWNVVWAVGAQRDVHGLVEPRLPGGQRPFPLVAGLAPVVGEWRR